MIVNEEGLKREYIRDLSGDLYAVFTDGKNVKAVVALFENLEFMIKKCEEVECFALPKAIPQKLDEVARLFTACYNNMLTAFQFRQTIDYYKQDKKFLSSDMMKKLDLYAKELTRHTNSQVEFLASLHPLWQGHTINGIKYKGESPNKLTSDNKTNKNVLGMMFGQKDFTLEQVSNEQNPKAKIKEFEVIISYSERE